MKKVLQVISDLEKDGIIEGYAIGGATALLFYTEPALTFDIDIFVFLPGNKDSKNLLNLASLYSALKSKGYHPEKEHVIIEDIPVQFIPVYSTLVENAVKHASKMEYEGIKTNVLTMEYLLAIMIDTDRPKDRERIKKLLDVVRIDSHALESILEQHNLKVKWEKLIERQ